MTWEELTVDRIAMLMGGAPAATTSFSSSFSTSMTQAPRQPCCDGFRPSGDPLDECQDPFMQRMSQQMMFAMGFMMGRMMSMMMGGMAGMGQGMGFPGMGMGFPGGGMGFPGGRMGFPGGTGLGLPGMGCGMMPCCPGARFAPPVHHHNQGHYSRPGGGAAPIPSTIMPSAGRVVSPLDRYRITDGFGKDRGDHVHNGIDLAAYKGDPIRAAMDGTVSRIGWDPKGYGNWVELSHADGTKTRYGHMSRFANIKEGQRVGAGSVIGAVGSTGNSTGPHLHFEWRDRHGNTMDPSRLIPFRSNI